MIIIIIMTMKENKNPSNQIKGKEIKSYLKKLSEQSSTDPTNSTNISVADLGVVRVVRSNPLN